MSDLKPCPFCGGEPNFSQTSQDSDTQFAVECRGCGAEIGFWLPWVADEDEKATAQVDVVTRWNTRKGGGHE